MHNDQYIQRAKAAVEEAQRKKAGYNGECSQCVYSRLESLNGRRCGHPAVQLVAFNLTNAYAKNRIVECAQQRDHSSTWGPVVCGPNGALFEKKMGLLDRLFRRATKAI